MHNLSGLTFPHTDTPKNHPVLGPNHCRGVFRGVCNTPLHGYVHNSSSFIFPHTNTPKTHPISPFPIGIHPNSARFYTQTFSAGHFGAYAFAPLHGYVQNLTGFRPKPSARNISGRMLLRSYTGTCKTRPVSHFRIRIRQKCTRFYPSQ